LASGEVLPRQFRNPERLPPTAPNPLVSYHFIREWSYHAIGSSSGLVQAIRTPAWRAKPSWMLVATKDRTINPDLERWYAARAKSHKVEVSGASHSVYVSRPKEVAPVIEEAASHAR
jgi:pimeloyl-ACP methyl ester carboxylesterase